MFEDAVNMPGDCQSLRLSLRLECARLLDWGDLAGLSDHNNHAQFDRKLKANRATIMALLSEMKTRIDRLRTISLRSDDVLLPASYGAAGHSTATAKQLHLANRKEELTDADLEQFRSVLESSDHQLRSRKKKLLTRGWERVVDLGRGVTDIAKQPCRIRWVLSDKDAFKTEVARLKELTDYLHETLGDYQMSILIEQSRETCMAMLQMTSSMGEMKELLKAVGMAASRSGIESELRPWLSLGDVARDDVVSGATDPERPLTLFAQLTRFRYNIARLEGTPPGKGALPDDGRLNGLKFNGNQLENLVLHHVRATGAYRVPATYFGGAAWVEWKAYHSVRHQEAPGKFYYGPAALVRTNLERLVAILHMNDRPAQFRVPLCAGYYDDEENQRFGLVYELPEATPAAAEAETLSLSQLLLLHQGRAPAPLHSRISLAKELATSLYFLHAVNWLHKGLRGESILVPTRGGIPDYSRPYISGFEYSRPDEQDRTSTAAPEAWAVYTHPDYLGIDREGYRKTFDMYSMGIILLEIAWWKPAEEILGFTEVARGKNEPPARQDGSPREKHESAGKKDQSQERNGRAAGMPEAALEDDDKPPAEKAYSKDSLDDLKSIRRRLLVEEPALLEHVSATMGSRYFDAVRACIGGLEHFRLPKDADETRDVIATLLQQAYLRLVVDVLQGIIV